MKRKRELSISSTSSENREKEVQTAPKGFLNCNSQIGFLQQAIFSGDLQTDNGFHCK